MTTSQTPDGTDKLRMAISRILIHSKLDATLMANGPAETAAASLAGLAGASCKLNSADRKGEPCDCRSYCKRAAKAASTRAGSEPTSASNDQ